MKQKYFMAAVAAGVLLLGPKEAVQAETVKVTSHKNIGVSVANSYVNVRKSANTSSEVVGKLHRGKVAKVVDKEGDWLEINSGKVTGYVNKPYLAVGSAAKEYLLDYANPTVKVTADSLRVRKKKSTDSEILGLIKKGTKYKVLSRGSKWTKIKYKDKSGYVSNDYVDLYYTIEYAISTKEQKDQVQDKVESGNQSSQNANSEISKGEKIASYATKFVGNPYVWGGTSLTNGADCSGFLQTLFKKFGYSIPRTSKEQAKYGKRVSVANRKPGDIISYATNGVVNHVGLYIGNNRIVHASTPKSGIKISKYNYKPVYNIRRIV